MSGAEPQRPPTLREDLALEAAHYHPGAQAARFGYLFAGSLAVQVLSGAHIAGWADLRSLIMGAAVVAWRQWRKTVSLQAAQRVADEHQPGAHAAPAAAQTP